MSDIEWQPLPSPMWPDPAVWTDVGDFTLLVFTQDGVWCMDPPMQKSRNHVISVS